MNSTGFENICWPVNSGLPCITGSYWKVLLLCSVVYVSTGGAEEMDNESFCEAADCNASMVYFYTLTLNYSGGVSLSSLHLDALKGYALKWFEPAIKARSILMPFFAVLFFICSKIWTEENHYCVYCLYFCTSVGFCVCLLQTKFIFQKTKLQ